MAFVNNRGATGHRAPTMHQGVLARSAPGRQDNVTKECSHVHRL